MHLVMLETNGNQRYVFSSPRQRENVGGSYLLTMLAPWTLALAEQEGIKATEVSVSSGKIILTVPDEDSARRLIGKVTRRVLALAPGMDVTGVFTELSTEPDEPPAITEADLSGIHVIAGRYALSRPPAEARFPQAPFLQRGHDSVLPAAPPAELLNQTPSMTTAYSLASQVKRACSREARQNLVSKAERSEALKEVIAGRNAAALLADSLFALEKAFDADRITQKQEDGPSSESTSRSIPDLSKIAVIHIDGNGVGAIMQSLETSMQKVPEQVLEQVISCRKADADALRRFLLQVNTRLDTAVERSFFTAWASVAQWWLTANPRSSVIPVVPILLGGDDVTVLTEGSYALPFMVTYLRAYEEATSRDALLCHLSPRAQEQERPSPMTAAAGAVIVPRPFPFHLAYDLSENLVSKAKKVGKSAGQGKERSTLTYHALFDSTIVEADELIKDYETFTARPYWLHDTHGPTSQSCPKASAAEDSAEEKNGPAAKKDLPHQSWPHMVNLARHFRGLISEDARAFPKTRAARIRGLLSDRALAAAQGDGSREKKLEAIIDDEWQDARRVLGDTLIDTIDDPRYVFDLLELADLLPVSYLEQAAPIAATSTPVTSEAATSAPATSQEEQ
ncbi:hypothetical protein [Actinomyces capricornis]|uniref:Uncharacterized protein n=1 Tax=Actinomyces capricornis TaxID=2755559 RepID=A0ABM7UEE9_9ACTO|nr:hypothetical protein [Actinomyces capricornis]BDA65549.1 hypothetical protein MANAM107_23830 [Actinomyces capricornis]